MDNGHSAFRPKKNFSNNTHREAEKIDVKKGRSSAYPSELIPQTYSLTSTNCRV